MAGLGVLPIERWLNIAILSRGQVIAILCALCVYVLLDMQWTVIAAGFKCDGNYARGTLLGNIVRFCTNACSVAAVAFHASPLIVALTLVCFRFLGNWTCQFVLTRKSPWLHYGYGHAHISVIRKLFGPAIAFMAFPAGNAFILRRHDGPCGRCTIGPIAAVCRVYSTVRTLTRFVYQTVDMITNGVWAEMSAALGAGNIMHGPELCIAAHARPRLGCRLAAALLILAVFEAQSLSAVWPLDASQSHIGSSFVLYPADRSSAANALWLSLLLSCPLHGTAPHQRLSPWFYVSATLASLPIAYLFDEVDRFAWGRRQPFDGGSMHDQLCPYRLPQAPA